MVHASFLLLPTAGVESIRNNRQKIIGPITEQLCVCCHSNIHGVMHLLCKQFAMYYMLLIHINESIEGWAPVTVISPISGQQGTTVNIGHLDGRHYVSALQLDYRNDRISGYEIIGVTNVNNYAEPGNN